MPSTDGKLELKAKTSMAQTASQTGPQPYEYAKGLNAFGLSSSYVASNVKTDTGLGRGSTLLTIFEVL
jgi:hypothetical protein